MLPWYHYAKRNGDEIMNRKLKARIIELFGTQADFAQVIQEDESFVSKIIRGRRVLSPEKLRIWSEVLGCTPEIFDVRPVRNALVEMER